MSFSDNEFFRQLLEQAAKLPPYRQPPRPTREQTEEFERLVADAVRRAENVKNDGSVTPDLSVPGHTLPNRVRFSKYAVIHGQISEQLIARYETGDYPTLEDHLARRTPAARPYLSIADEIHRRRL